MKPVPSNRPWSRRFYAGIAPLCLATCLAAGAGAAGCTTTPVTGRQQFNLLSLDDDKAAAYRRAFAAGVKRRFGRYASVVSDVESA